MHPIFMHPSSATKKNESDLKRQFIKENQLFFVFGVRRWDSSRNLVHAMLASGWAEDGAEVA
jgi:hypothetical protein